jgi:crotonobetainyl-CoA:carnitine CoA-transferase CaiB-like acyl-CoA transferase
MARLKLTYEDVATVNPRIIHVGAYGYGQDGPYAAQPAYDDLIQGMVDLPSILVFTTRLAPARARGGAKGGAE